MNTLESQQEKVTEYFETNSAKGCAFNPRTCQRTGKSNGAGNAKIKGILHCAIGSAL